MKKLNKDELIKSAGIFCKTESGKYRKELFGVTDGKAIGTFVEHLFESYLSEHYEMEIGSSANGLDLPSVNTDIKVTSIKQPQSSCPFKESKQKIYGLGYNLIVFVYKKVDDTKLKKGMLEFVSCTYIDKSRTADFQITTGLNRIIENNGNADDVFALMNMAKDIMANRPEIGYLTISNALQWRLQYSRIVSLNESVEGISTIVKYDIKRENE